MSKSSSNSTSESKPSSTADGELPEVRIRRAELKIARLHLDYWTWYGSMVGKVTGSGIKAVQESLLNLGIAEQNVEIAEARLEQALRDRIKN